MEACINAQEDRITRIVTEYSDLLLRLALHHVGDMATAEDMIQSAFLRCMTSAPVFENSVHERAWLIRTTINLCNDYHRSAWKRKRAELPEDLPDEPQPEPDHEVLDAVRRLPSRERTAIYLYYYLGMPVKEIALATQEKEGTVSSHLFRARKRLKKLLGGETDEC